MGVPMVQNLLRLGHAVTVYNRTPGKAKALLALGAVEAMSVPEAVKDAEVVITMLSDDTAVKEMVFGTSGVLQNLPPKSIHLCMSTIEVETSIALASAHAQAGQGYVAAPVFGRADTAESRHIWIVAGGPEPQVNRCRPVFEALGRGYTRLGPNAALAHAMKLGGNLLTIAMELAVSEILTYAKQTGLPPAEFLRFLNTAIFRSHMVQGYGGLIERPSFDPEDKTLDLVANEMLFHTAKDMGVAVPVPDLLNARLQAAEARGWGEQDLAELSNACRQETGLEEIPGPPHTETISIPISLPAPDPASIPTSVVEPEASLAPRPPVLRPPRRPQREPKPPIASKAMPFDEGEKPQPEPPPEDKQSYASPNQEEAVPSVDLAHPAQMASSQPSVELTPPAQLAPSHPFAATRDGETILLDLSQISHFETIGGHVWAWSHGKRYKTNWGKLIEVEAAFNRVLFLLIKRHTLLRPEAVIDLRSTFGGGAKAKVSGNMELDVGRGAVPRLKELLGV
jgi:3-hydroxyisobutyrate dehydrogenase-like beta-hydroxyacid dehydrogenase